MSNTLELTQALIARQSVSPADGGCQALMIERLAAAGFAVESLRFGPVDNFWAKRGSGGPVFCFAGHTDVVPSGPLDEWRSDPFEPVIRDGLLYGRGAADMKSGLAAMLTASEEFVALYPKHRGTIAFLITSDEEGPSVDGTRRVVEVLRERARKHRLVPGRRTIERKHSGRHDQNRPSRQLERAAHRARSSGPHCLSAAGGQSGACTGARTRGTDHAPLGSGQRAFPAHQFSGLEYLRRNRCAECDSGRIAGALQSALLHRTNR